MNDLSDPHAEPCPGVVYTCTVCGRQFCTVCDPHAHERHDDVTVDLLPDSTDLLAALAHLSDPQRRHLTRLACDLADPDKVSGRLAACADVFLALAVLAAETTDAETRMLAELDAQVEDDDGLAGEIVGP